MRLHLPRKANLQAWLLFITLLPSLLSSCTTSSQKETQRSERGFTAQKAMVVSAHPEASRIGMEIMQKGGNAYDAAVATQFALAVAFPVAGNIGGGGFMVYRSATGQTGALDYRETAPGAAVETMYQDSAGNVIDGLSTDSHLAVGVPGAVDGMVKVHEKLGSLPWEDLVQPAIDLARNGVVLTQKEADGLNDAKEAFLENNKHVPYLVRDNTWQAGDTLRHPDLARTLERIRDKGRAGFYAGETADLLVEEMKRGGGIISHRDLENYSSVWRQPVTGTDRKSVV